MLKNTINLVSSIFLFVFLTFMLGVFYDTPFIQQSILMVFCFLILKIVLYSGIYAALVEIISGEEFLLTLNLLKKNTKECWKEYVLILGIPIVSFIVLSLFIPTLKTLPPAIYSSCFNMPLLFLLGWLLVRKKYSHLVKSFSSSISFKEVGVILFLYSFDQALLFLSYGVDIKGPAVNTIGFAREWLEYVQFVYLVTVYIEKNSQIKKHFENIPQVFLINPFGPGTLRSLGYAWFVAGHPPAFVILKTFISAKYKIREFNQKMWSDRYYSKNALVALTSYTSNCYEAYRIAKEFKKRGATVVMGGPHVTYLPNEALEFCDSVVIGEAEEVWPQLLEDYEKGALQKTYFGGALSEKNSEKIFDHLLKSSPDVIKDFLETSRGCKFKCHFCTVPALSNGRIKNATIVALVELINKIKHKYRQVTFIDNNIYNDPGYARELFKALKPLNIKWRTSCTIDIAKNEETLRLAKESGCEFLLIGYEVSGNSLGKSLGGKFSMAEQYAKYTKTIRDLGIKIRANFIFGFESDNFKNIFKLWKYCLSLNAYSAGLSFLTPLPGSKLFDDLISKNQILNLNWRKYTMTHLVFKHKYLTPLSVSILFPFVTVFYLLTASRIGTLLLLLFLNGGIVIYLLKI
jgi:hypothetical protein